MRTYRLDEVERALADANSFSDEEPEEAYVNEDTKLVLEGPRVYVSDFDVTLRLGCLMIRDSETGQFDADHTVSVLYQGKGENSDDWVDYTTSNFVQALCCYVTNHVLHADDECAGMPPERYGSCSCQVLVCGEY